MKTILAALMSLFLTAMAQAQPSDRDSRVFQYVKALIVFDKDSIRVIGDQGTIRIRVAPKGQYFSTLYYDRMTGFISYEKCRTTRTSPSGDEWTFELTVWDYHTDSTWVLDRGSTYNGEGLRSAEVWGFDPRTRSGFMNSIGWESHAVVRFDPRTRVNVADDLQHYVRPVTRFGKDSLIVFASHEGGPDAKYYMISFATGQRRIIPFSEVKKYSKLALSQFGRNVLPNKASRLLTSLGPMDWNPTGTVFVCHSLYETGHYFESWLFDTDTDYEEILSSHNQSTIPIWK